MSTTTIAGKPSNTIGEKDSTLVLRGSSIKIQWGNKFIDLIKNGKINSDSLKLLKTADSTEELTTDGLYLVGDSVWAVIGGTKVLLSGDSTTTYVSYLTEQKDVTGELKERALTNIGFYYKTLEEALNSGLTSGIIYVLGDNKLYIIKDGVVSEYGITLNNSQNPEKLLEELYILDYSLMVDGEEYAKFDNNNIQLNKIAYFKEGINSYGANASYGYRLYIKDGKSYLEVDNIICRNPIGGSENSDKAYYPIKYFNNENLIIDLEFTNNKTIITLLFTNNTYLVGDILYTSLTKNNLVIEVSIVIDEVLGENKYSVTPSEEGNLVNRKIFSKKIKQNGEYQPISKIEGYNYDLLDKYQEINTRIGYIANIPIDRESFVDNYTGTDIGLYSNNALLQYSNILSSAIYDSKLRNAKFVTAAEYSTDVTLAEDLNDKTIVTAEWVKKQINDLEIPEGGEDYSDDIATLNSKITTAINTFNTTISELNTTIVELNSTITNLKSEIENGNVNNPIVLISGTLTKNSNGIFVFSGNKKEYITEITAETKNGLMTIYCKTKEKTVTFTSSNITLYNSGITSDIGESEIMKRGVGAHWFESRFGIDNTIHVREFHLGNADNDSWNSDIWVHSDAVNSINITVFGYAVLL